MPQHGQRAVTAFAGHRRDVGAERFADAQAVEREQGHQRVFLRRSETSGHQQRTGLVAIQGRGVQRSLSAALEPAFPVI